MLRRAQGGIHPMKCTRGGWRMRALALLLVTLAAAAGPVGAIDKTANENDRTRPLFPMDTNDIVGSVLCLPIAMLAAGAGLGGGPLFIPLLIVVVEFSVGFAIPLSKAMIFGVSIAQFLINVSKRSVTRPNTHTLIDYDIALLVEPMTLLGTTWGVFLNIIFPDWMTLISISLLLLVITSRTSVNALKVYHRETESDIYKPADSVDENTSLRTVSAESYSPSKRSSLTVNWGDGEESAGGSMASGERESVARLLLRASGPIAVLVCTWAYVFVVSLLKGGGSGEDSIVGVEQCSLVYWVLVLSEIPVIVGVTVLWGLHLRNRRQKMEQSHQVLEGEVDWNMRNRIVFPALSFFAGVVAGMMGLGGGMIKSPLLLELGNNKNAQQASATCAFMILFTSSSTTLQYLILGRLNVAYAVWYGLMGFVGSLIGKIFINALVKRYKKSAYIILCVAVFLGLGTIALMTEGTVDMVLSYRDATLFAFSSICS
eukprot:TRINITY_DN11604_c0_g1_i1.p1 TRINITY_DN11604_c0_g1~~TRINITY_DN11604_c0_g1_i1.p1  ORF type:complete len:486 (+),score=139.06 TRINITY_DN11604_c0_g1_i1:122-1579(+)